MPFGWDTVLLQNGDKIIKKTFPAEVSELDAVLQFLSALAGSVGADEKQLDRLLIIAEELFVNIASYAYENGGNADLSCVLTDNPVCIHLLFSDSGVPYDPMKRTEEDAAASVASLTPGGLGIMMVKKMADGMEYRYQGGKNQLYIRKLLQG